MKGLCHVFYFKEKMCTAKRTRRASKFVAKVDTKQVSLCRNEVLGGAALDTVVGSVATPASIARSLVLYG